MQELKIRIKFQSPAFCLRKLLSHRFLDANRISCRSLLHACFLSLCSTGRWEQAEGGHGDVAEPVATAAALPTQTSSGGCSAAVLQPAAQHSLISCKGTQDKENWMETKSSYRNAVCCPSYIFSSHSSIIDLNISSRSVLIPCCTDRNWTSQLVLELDFS